MVYFVIGIFCTAVAFLPPHDWVSAWGFWIGGFNICAGICTLSERVRA